MHTSVLPSFRPSTPSTAPGVYSALNDLVALQFKARGFSFLPRQPVHSLLSGRYASRLRGRGLNFEEMRHYQRGDDIRTMDWKATARTRKPHVRVYTEERDRPALIVVDQRMSMFFGSKLNMKSVTAAETAAIAAFAILDQGDRVGGIVFGDEVVAEIRPLRSRRTLDALTTAIADANALLSADAPAVEAMGLNRPLEAAQRLAGTNHLIIVVSDFDGIDARTETLLGGMLKHNDVMLCLVTDPMAHEIADDLQIVISDGILQAEIDTRSGRVRRSLAEMTSGRVAEVLALEKKLGVPVLPLNAGEATLPQIRRLLGLSAGRP